MKKLKEFEKKISLGTILALLVAILVTFFLTKKLSNNNSISSEEKSCGEVRIGEDVIKNLEAQGIHFADLDIEEEDPNDFQTIYKGKILGQYKYLKQTKSGKEKIYYVLHLPVRGFPDRAKVVNVPEDIAIKEWRGKLLIDEEIYYKRLDKSKVSEEERDIIPDYYFSGFVEKVENK